MTEEWSGFMRLLDLLAQDARHRHAGSSGCTTVYLVGAASHVLECTLCRRTEDLDLLCEDQVLRATITNPAVHVEQLPLSAVITPGWKERAVYRGGLSTHALRVWFQELHDRLIHKLDRGEARDFDDFVEIAQADRRYSSQILWSRAEELLPLRPSLRTNLEIAVSRLEQASGLAASAILRRA